MNALEGIDILFISIEDEVKQFKLKYKKSSSYSRQYVDKSI